jgi:hypothetical protein
MSVCLQWGTFSAEDACNFALNIYSEGDILSIGKMMLWGHSDRHTLSRRHWQPLSTSLECLLIFLRLACPS